MADCQHDAHDHGPEQGNVQNQRQEIRKSREELLDELADRLAGAEDDSDVEQLERCLAALDALEEIAPDFDAERSLEEFHQKYNAAPAAPSRSQQTDKPKRHKFTRHLARAAIIAAVLCAFVAVAQAKGFDILGAIARWTDAQFHLEWINGSSSDGADVSLSDAIEYPSLQDALDKYDVEYRIAPSELPADASLDRLFVKEENHKLMFYASYKILSGSLSITFRQKDVLPFSEVEKDIDEIEVYTTAEIEHHIIQDIDQMKAIWHNGPWECHINGDISRDEMIAMIDSIYR